MDGQPEALFVIKNGSGSKPDVQLRASLSSTVAQLKSLIQREYPGSPAPSEQTLIFGGKVLKLETALLSAIIGPDVREPISMHMVVKSHPPPSAPALQPLGAPAAAASSRRTPRPAAAASTAHQTTGTQPQTSTSPAGPSASRGSGRPSAQQPSSGGIGTPFSTAAGAPYQPDATSAWMQYQNAAAAAAWAAPAVSAPGSQPADAAFAQFNPALAAAYSAAMASLNDAQPGATSSGPSVAPASSGTGAAAGGTAAGSGAGGAANGAAVPPPPMPAAADPIGMLLGMHQPMGFPIVALVPVGMMPPYGMMPGFPQVGMFPQQQPDAAQQQPQTSGTATPHFVFGAMQNQSSGQQQQQQQQPQQQYDAAGAAMAAAFGGVPFGMQPPGAAFPAFPFGPPQPPLPPFGAYPFPPPPLPPLLPGFGAPPPFHDNLDPLRHHPAAEGVRERRRVVPQGAPRGGVDRPDAFLRRDAAGNYVLVDARGQVAARAARPVVRRVQINLNLRVILQVAVLLLLLYQHCPPGRFLLIVIGGALLYLSAFSPLRAWLQRIAGLGPPAAGHPGAGHNGPAHAAGGANAANPAGANAAAAAAAGGHPNGGNADGGHIAPGVGDAGGGGAAAGAGGGNARRGGVLRELQALLVGFFTSLLPGWNMNPEDAAAFAAAQQMAAAEAARDNPGGGPGPGVDADING